MQNQRPSLCAPWSAYVDPPSEDIRKEQHLSMKLWAKLCTDCALLENHLSEVEPLVFVHRIMPLNKVGARNLELRTDWAGCESRRKCTNYCVGMQGCEELITIAIRHCRTATWWHVVLQKKMSRKRPAGSLYVWVFCCAAELGTFFGQ